MKLPPAHFARAVHTVVIAFDVDLDEGTLHQVLWDRTDPLRVSGLPLVDWYCPALTAEQQTLALELAGQAAEAWFGWKPLQTRAPTSFWRQDPDLTSTFSS